jgi:RNA polymerase sigma-70 factor (sigma-E family)
MSDAVRVVDVAAIYADHRLALVRLGVLLVDRRETAEDIVQEAFLGLHRSQSRLRDPEAALAYLRVAVINGSRSALRRRSVARKNARPIDPGEGPGADAELLVAEEHRAVLAAVRRLPDRQREVLVLRYWSGLSEAQIAAAMGISAGTVKSTASKAVAKVATMIGDVHD